MESVFEQQIHAHSYVMVMHHQTDGDYLFLVADAKGADTKNDHSVSQSGGCRSGSKVTTAQVNLVQSSAAEVVPSGLAMYVLGGTTAAPVVTTATTSQNSLAKFA